MSWNIDSNNNTNVNMTCITINDILTATQDDMHLQSLSTHIIEGWPSNRNDIKQDIQLHWTLRGYTGNDWHSCYVKLKIHNTSGITDQDSRITTQQLYDIEKARLLVRDLVYWINMNTDIENTLKTSQHALDSNRHSQMTKALITKVHANHGQWLPLRCIQFITSISFVLFIITADFL